MALALLKPVMSLGAETASASLLPGVIGERAEVLDSDGGVGPRPLELPVRARDPHS